MKHYFMVDQSPAEKKRIPQDIIRSYQENLFNRREEQEPGEQITSIPLERKVLACVMAGDLKGLDQINRETNYRFYVGHLSDDALMQARYLFVACMTSVSRAAIQGGMTETEALILSDTYIQKMDREQSAEAISRLLSISIRDYTRRICALRLASDSPVVAVCRNYIASHLHSRITLHDLCEHAQCSQSHLAAAFKRDTGLTPMKYVAAQKMDLARHILSATQYPVYLIAEFLAFSSPSHFVAAFREDCGMTPNDYRRQYAGKNRKGIRV